MSDVDNSCMENSQELELFTDGLEIDDNFYQEEVVVKRKYQTIVRNKTASNSVIYDADVLDRRYGELPEEGVTWANLPCLDRNYFTYAKCTPTAKHDENENFIKYEKKYGRWNKEWGNLRNNDDYGVVVPHPYIVVDLDNTLEAKAVFAYIKDNNIKCLVLKTDRGLHLWFRLKQDFDYERHKVKNEADISVIGTLKADYRVNGGGVSCLKFRGKERSFIYGTEYSPDEWDILPVILRKLLNTNAGEYKFLGLREGSRDALLTRYKAALYGNELLDVAQCYEVLCFINKYLLVEPLDDDTMEKFGDENSYKKIKRNCAETDFFNKSKFLHEKCARYISEHNYFLPLDNKSFPMIYKDGYYQEDEDYVESLIRELVPELTIGQVDQVKRCLHIQSTNRLRDSPERLEEGVVKESPYWINLNNGRLCMLTGEFTEHTPEEFDTQRVPVTYKPALTCKDVDKVLNTVFEDDQDRITLFYEILGTCLTRDNHVFTRSFFFLGEGSNGKSTLISMLRAVVGARNISCIKPSDMKSSSFNLCEMHHKLANIVEELAAEDVSETDIYKQVVSGDVVAANRKFKNPVLFRPYCTVIYAMNKIPNFADKSLGMTRRYEVLPFTKNFQELKQTDMENYDPNIADKITTEEAKSYLLNRAVEAYKELYKRREYTLPQCCRDAKDDYLASENPVVQWIEDRGITSEHLTKYSITAFYQEFKEYQTDSLGYSNPWLKKTWVQEVLRYYSKELNPPKRVRPDKSNRNYQPMMFVLKDSKLQKDVCYNAADNTKKESDAIASSMGIADMNEVSGDEIPF